MAKRRQRFPWTGPVDSPQTSHVERSGRRSGRYTPAGSGARPPSPRTDRCSGVVISRRVYVYLSCYDSTKPADADEPPAGRRPGGTPGSSAPARPVSPCPAPWNGEGDPDLSESKLREGLRMGAVEVTGRQLAVIIRSKRSPGGHGTLTVDAGAMLPGDTVPSGRRQAVQGAIRYIVQRAGEAANQHIQDDETPRTGSDVSQSGAAFPRTASPPRRTDVRTPPPCGPLNPALVGKSKPPPTQGQQYPRGSQQ